MSEMTLEPCPFCDNARIDFCDEGATSFFYCPECGMSGPRGHFRIPAADNWNMLPRRLRWTREKPTGPGIYFYRKNPDALFTVIGVYEERDRTLCFTMLGSKKQRILEYTTGEWAGPIQEPEVP